MSAKGDILIGTSSNTSKRLPAGPAGYVLKTRSTCDIVHWALPDNGRAGAVCSSLMSEEARGGQGGQINWVFPYLMSNNTVKVTWGDIGSGMGHHPTDYDNSNWSVAPQPVTMPPNSWGANDFDHDKMAEWEVVSV